MVLNQLDIHMQKNKVGLLSHSILKKKNSKWIEDLNPRPEIEKLLEENKRGTSLVVQGLRLYASTAGGMGSTPGQGTKIPHVMQHGQRKKEKENLPDISLGHGFLDMIPQAQATRAKIDK